MTPEREKLIQALENYTAFDENEAKSVKKTLDLLKNHERCFWRDYIPRGHMTGSAFLLNKDLDKVLLTHHATLNIWLQFGGHADGDEDIFNVALKEGIEESGIDNIQALNKDIFSVSYHPIPANPKRGEDAHYHHDICFVFYVPDDTPYQISHESNALRWFTLEELKGLIRDDERGRRFANMAQKWEKILHKPNSAPKFTP